MNILSRILGNRITILSSQNIRVRENQEDKLFIMTVLFETENSGSFIRIVSSSWHQVVTLCTALSSFAKQETNCPIRRNKKQNHKINAFVRCLISFITIKLFKNWKSWLEIPVGDKFFISTLNLYSQLVAGVDMCVRFLMASQGFVLSLSSKLTSTITWIAWWLGKLAQMSLGPSIFFSLQQLDW